MRTLFKWMAMVMLVTGAVMAAAPTAAVSGETSARGEAEADAPPAQGSLEAKAKASDEAEAEAELEARLRMQEIRKRGHKVEAKARASAEAKLEAEAEQVNVEAETKGSEQVAARLAAEFDIPAEVLLEERSTSRVGWGELMIAHTLMANSRTRLELDQLLELRHEGMGWGEIAAGMGLDLGEAVRAVNAEAKVARGLARADGKVAAIRGGNASASAAAKAGIGAEVGKASVGARANVGVQLPKVKLGR